jgi:hypothetical protein
LRRLERVQDVFHTRCCPQGEQTMVGVCERAPAADGEMVMNRGSRSFGRIAAVPFCVHVPNGQGSAAGGVYGVVSPNRRKFGQAADRLWVSWNGSPRAAQYSPQAMVVVDQAPSTVVHRAQIPG